MSPAGILFIVFHGLFIPWAVIRAKKRVASKLSSVRLSTHLVSTIVQLVFFLALAVAVAHVEWIELFPAPSFRAIDLAAGAAMLAITIAFMAPRWKRKVETRTPIVKLFAPRTPGEHALWICVSLAAAVAEECTYRGVLYDLVARFTESPIVSVLFCSAIFGIAHMIQGWKSSAVIAIFALGFHGLVYVSGSLYIAMAVHFLYDVTAGFAYGHYSRSREKGSGLISSV